VRPSLSRQYKLYSTRLLKLVKAPQHTPLT
jgi:hypothetical protein